MKDLLKLLWPGGQLVAIALVCLVTLVTQSRSPLSALEQGKDGPETSGEISPAELIASMQRDNFGVSERERLVRVEVVLDSIRSELQDIKQHLAQHSDWILYLLAGLVGFTPAKELVRGIRERHKRTLEEP